MHNPEATTSASETDLTMMILKLKNPLMINPPKIVLISGNPDPAAYFEFLAIRAALLPSIISLVIHTADIVYIIKSSGRPRCFPQGW